MDPAKSQRDAIRSQKHAKPHAYAGTVPGLAQWTAFGDARLAQKKDNKKQKYHHSAINTNQRAAGAHYAAQKAHIKLQMPTKKAGRDSQAKESGAKADTHKLKAKFHEEKATHHTFMSIEHASRDPMHHTRVKESIKQSKIDRNKANASYKKAIRSVAKA
ncbi:hypothetical protein CVT25_011499 [Psilocybe cyanescens]|uniref:Uncharacterized protein n=1 Tax=Psilocybe cyanescens TaxID=93625 RepID=A0A409XAB0_PSICY|nr:hypothetical protein CVT25_011499 [Psilocybe cyanescens]